MAHILENPQIWSLFRKVVDITIGWDSQKKETIETIGGGVCNNKNLKVLDLGCGIGNTCSLFDGSYTGIDLNENYIDYANKNFGGTNRIFVAADAVSYSYKMTDEFDLVCLFDFLHHLPDDLCLSLLKSANRLSKKYVFINEPIKSKNQPWIYRAIAPFDRGKFFRTSQELQAIIKESGLAIIDNPSGNIILCAVANAGLLEEVE